MSLRQIVLGLIVLAVSIYMGTYSVSAQSITRTVIVINQVRGEECCGKGNLANLELQLKTVTKLGIPATFVMRYDALTDQRYVTMLKKYRSEYPELIDLGVMIEIIPSLALDTSVSYKGSNETWYQAHNAFTIGYPLEARKKILDTLFAKYSSVMGTYPRVSSAWMIDTDSLNYIQKNYGVQYHQITREQWGTDSYTLYGGPPHFPYPASKNWLMVPDFSRDDAPMIVRQTVTDPVYNYGDTTSSHTSQPNDYMRSGAKIDYFQKLITQAFDTTLNPVGFACLGLENNMEERFQNEYIDQLTWIKEYAASNQITLSKITDMKSQFANRQVTAYTGTATNIKSTWITTPKYRVRLLEKDGQLSITDIRVYSPDLTDPYNETIAKHEGYWIVPFLLDGSRWYDGYKSTYKILDHLFIPTQNDTQLPSSRFILTDAKDDGMYKLYSNGIDTVTVSYGFNDTDEHVMAFGKEEIQALSLSARSNHYNLMAYTPKKFPVKYSLPRLSWEWEGKTAYAMELTKKNKLYFFSFDTTHVTEWNSGRYLYYPYAYPESTGRYMNTKYTTISVDNKYAIAGRNPIRLVLQPHDSLNFPIILDEEPEIKTIPTTLEVKRLGELRKSQYQYVDIFSETPTQVDATIVFKQKGDRITKEIVGYIAPDCKRNIKSCLIDPRGTFWYVLTKVNDWWRSR